MKDTPKIVILGAGMSAVACAENLLDSFQVELYEKSKGVGGRLCSKKYDGTRYHFGAQFCTYTNSEFQNFLVRNHAKKFNGSAYDCAKRENINTNKYFVHAEGMQGLLKQSAKSLDIKSREKCIKADTHNKVVHFESGLEVTYDILISSLPLPQAKELLRFDEPSNVIFDPCLAVGFMIGGSKANKYNAYKVVNKDISWAASSKYYNAKMNETWVLQFSPKTSKKMFDSTEASLKEFAAIQLKDLLGIDATIQNSYIFKWKYAQCNRSSNEQSFITLDNDVFAIGDWNISPRVESAFLSGRALAKFLVSNKK
jgi:hypothetical protein